MATFWRTVIILLAGLIELRLGKAWEHELNEKGTIEFTLWSRRIASSLFSSTNVRGAASLTPDIVMSSNGLFSRKYCVHYITGVFKIDIHTQGSEKTWNPACQILLAQVHFLLVLVNDFVGRWLALTLAHWASEFKKLLAPDRTFFRSPGTLCSVFTVF